MRWRFLGTVSSRFGALTAFASVLFCVALPAVPLLAARPIYIHENAFMAGSAAGPSALATPAQHQ
eukprot:gene8851-8024_t